MNNRLTIQDLAALLAERTGKEKSTLELFLKEFIAVISEGVYADKIVKVKGLGIFKIIPVEQRESIHVNTGERFLIPAHYKFSFLPDKELRELVNKPFAFFETTELGENADFSDMDLSEDDTDEKETDDESIEEVMPEPIKQPEQPEQIVQPEEEPELIIPHVKRKKKFPFDWYLLGLGIILLVFLYFIVSEIREYYRLGNQLEYLLEASKDSLSTNEEKTFSPKVESELQEEEASQLEQQHRDSLTRIAVEQATACQDSIGRATASKVIARVKIEAGSRLTVIALEYYGSKVFWVYLYEYNKSIIKDPNNVPIGTVIEVPAPELYGINSRDRVSVEKAATLQTEILTSKP